MRLMKKIILVTGIFSSVVISAVKAQFEYIKPHDIKELSSRRLIVLVEEPEDVLIAKLKKKKKDIEAYKKAIEQYNTYLQNAVTKFCKLSKGDIEFLTLDEINRISDKKNYAVIYCRSAKQNQLDQGYLQVHGILWWPDFMEVAHDRDFTGRMTILGISLLDKFETFPIYQCPVPDVFPTQADLDFVLNSVSNYISYRGNHKHVDDDKMDETLLKENQPALKDKILLLRRDLLDKKIGNTKMIDKIYPYPYLITSKDSVDQAIESGDPKYAVIVVTPYDLDVIGNGTIEYVQYTYSTGDGSILATSGLLDMATAGTNASIAKPLITKNALMDLSLYLKPQGPSLNKDNKNNATKKK